MRGGEREVFELQFHKAFANLPAGVFAAKIVAEFFEQGRQIVQAGLRRPQILAEGALVIAADVVGRVGQGVSVEYAFWKPLNPGPGVAEQYASSAMAVQQVIDFRRRRIGILQLL